MIITIDGPAGSGKSTTARAVARQLRIRHLDSGAFYRALTLAALRAGISPERWNTLSFETLDRLNISGRPGSDGYALYISGRDVTSELRSDDVNAHVSRMASVPAVRQWLHDTLRAAASGSDLVADGRDMGTVIFPEADIKVFLTCSLETRARRRLLERGIAEPDAAQLAAEVESLDRRDRLDSERALAPLKPASDAIHLDTTGLTFDEQVRAVIGLVTPLSSG
jgi:cytidylate kinase